MRFLRKSHFFSFYHLTSAARYGIILVGIQRPGEGRPGPNFRSVYPIWKIFATSSDLSYALNFPVKLGPPEGRSGIFHMPIYSIQTSRHGGGRSVKICFFNIITYFFIKVKEASLTSFHQSGLPGSVGTRFDFS